MVVVVREDKRNGSDSSSHQHHLHHVAQTIRHDEALSPDSHPFVDLVKYCSKHSADGSEDDKQRHLVHGVGFVLVFERPEGD